MLLGKERKGITFSAGKRAHLKHLQTPVEIGTQWWYTEHGSGWSNILIILDLRSRLANPLLGTISAEKIFIFQIVARF